MPAVVKTLEFQGGERQARIGAKPASKKEKKKSTNKEQKRGGAEKKTQGNHRAIR